MHTVVKDLPRMPSCRAAALAAWVLLFGAAVAVRGNLVLAIIAAAVLISTTWRLFGSRQAMCVGIGAAALVMPVPWPIPIYLSLAAAALLLPRAREAIGRVMTLRLSHPLPSVVLMGLMVAGICLILAVWQLRHTWHHRDIAQPHLAIMAILVVGAALFTSVAEEVVWREYLYVSLMRQGALSTLLLISLSFGISHWAGLPGSWIGIISASLFGVVLGVLQDRGMLGSCIFLHFAPTLRSSQPSPAT